MKKNKVSKRLKQKKEKQQRKVKKKKKNEELKTPPTKKSGNIKQSVGVKMTKKTFRIRGKKWKIMED